METRQPSINIHRAPPPRRSCSVCLLDIDVDAGKGTLHGRGGNKDGRDAGAREPEKRESRAVPNNCQLFQARSLRREARALGRGEGEGGREERFLHGGGATVRRSARIRDERGRESEAENERNKEKTCRGTGTNERESRGTLCSTLVVSGTVEGETRRQTGTPEREARENKNSQRERREGQRESRSRGEKESGSCQDGATEE